MSRIFSVLELVDAGGDRFAGPAVRTKLLRTFGGQIAAQALHAAARTVGDDKLVNSLHGYFLSPGDPTASTELVVTRLRDGRSFSARSVTVTQGAHTLFTMHASFSVGTLDGIEHADTMREVPGPDEVPADASGLRRTTQMLLKEWEEFDIRVVPPDRYERNPYAASQQVVWFKSSVALPDAPTFHRSTLTYMSDMTLAQSAVVPHPDAAIQEASLDHAMWFFRPFRADEWLLYDQTSPVAAAGRALNMGRVFNREGQLVAVATQESLARMLAPGAQAIPMVGLDPHRRGGC